MSGRDTLPPHIANLNLMPSVYSPPSPGPHPFPSLFPEHKSSSSSLTNPISNGESSSSQSMQDFTTLDAALAKQLEMWTNVDFNFDEVPGAGLMDDADFSWIDENKKEKEQNASGSGGEDQGKKNQDQDDEEMDLKTMYENKVRGSKEGKNILMDERLEREREKRSHQQQENHQPPFSIQPPATSVAAAHNDPSSSLATLNSHFAPAVNAATQQAILTSLPQTTQQQQQLAAQVLQNMDPNFAAFLMAFASASQNQNQSQSTTPTSVNAPESASSASTKIPADSQSHHSSTSQSDSERIITLNQMSSNSDGGVKHPFGDLPLNFAALAQGAGDEGKRQGEASLKQGGLGSSGSRDPNEVIKGKSDESFSASVANFFDGRNISSSKTISIDQNNNVNDFSRRSSASLLRNPSFSSSTASTPGMFHVPSSNQNGGGLAGDYSQSPENYPDFANTSRHPDDGENSTSKKAKITHNEDGSAKAVINGVEVVVPPGHVVDGYEIISHEEDKRRRNTAASARFRLKKKEREQALVVKSRDLEDKVSMLEREVEGLRKENGWLRALVIHGVPQPLSSPLPQASSLPFHQTNSPFPTNTSSPEMYVTDEGFIAPTLSGKRKRN